MSFGESDFRQPDPKILRTDTRRRPSKFHAGSKSPKPETNTLNYTSSFVKQFIRFLASCDDFSVGQVVNLVVNLRPIGNRPAASNSQRSQADGSSFSLAASQPVASLFREVLRLHSAS